MRFRLGHDIEPFKRKSLIGQVVVVLLGLQLLFLSSFVALPLPTATGQNLNNCLHNQTVKFIQYLPVRWRTALVEYFPQLSYVDRPVRHSVYIPMTPVAIFVGYALGWQLGVVSSTLFLVAGLIGPRFDLYPFASGAGLGYYKELSFGYLLGMVLASFCAGRITGAQRTSVNQFVAVMVGLACVHVTGVAYLVGSLVVGSFLQIRPESHVWAGEELRNLSWYPLTWDFIFAVALVGIGLPFRWLVRTLCAPYLAQKDTRVPSLEDIG
ncbi:MAG: biotin transporter BioY [Candidatus Melainabacteria bacterium]|nr:biotin transporter BioY [Candidatus Melainabacteria bacterium]